MFTSQHIPEFQGPGKLFGTDEKSCPVNLPIAFCFPHWHHLLKGRTTNRTCLKKFAGWIFFEGEKNLRVMRREVNPQTLVHLCNSQK